MCTFFLFFVFLHPGFALIMMSTHVICILSNILVLKQLGCFFTASEESRVRCQTPFWIVQPFRVKDAGVSYLDKKGVTRKYRGSKLPETLWASTCSLRSEFVTRCSTKVFVRVSALLRRMRGLFHLH